jgi:proline dehydrogenase
MSLYSDFEILYEDRKNLIQETEEEIQKYCRDTVERFTSNYEVDSLVEKAIYKRLYGIKVMSNDLRPYQNYSVLVLRYRELKHGRRYVEKF